MSTTIASALEGIRTQITELETKRTEAQAIVKEATGELRSLRIAERALDPSARPAGKRTGGKVTDEVKTLMVELRTATQHQVAESLGRPKNSVKHALEQLVAQGVVRETGKSVRRSPEFAMVAEPAAE